MKELCPDFRIENVFVWNALVSSEMAFGLLYDSLVGKSPVFDALAVWKEMAKRIAEGVNMGGGLLLPHARVKEISSPLLAFGISSIGILDSSNERAKFVAMVLSPLNSPRAHTQVIGKIAKYFSEKSFCAQLLDANKERAYEILSEI